MGLEKSLQIFADIKKEFDLPVLTDVHDAAQCAVLAEVVDVLQIPAFLCRQTDLLLAAGKTGKAINVKKGQFLAPLGYEKCGGKIASTGNQNILLTERGVSFGYNTLVSDFRALPIMAETGYPVVFDATHSVQQPGGQEQVPAGSGNLCPCWPVPPWRLVARRCLLKHIKTLITRHLMAPIWFRLISWKRC